MTLGRVSVRGGFVLLVAALFYFDSTGLLFWVALAAVLHEAGHALVLRLLGGRVEQWEFSLRGIIMYMPRFPVMSYGKDFLATLSGPLFSLLTALVASRAAALTGVANLNVLAGVAFTQGLFNLLPASSLDGGRILHLALCWRHDERLADRVLFFTTAICTLLLAVGGVLAFLHAGRNFTLLLAAGYAVLSLSGGRSHFTQLSPPTRRTTN